MVIKLLSLIVLTTLALSLNAQNVTFGADIFNRYIWRGLDLGGTSPSIQPNVSIEFTKGDHSITLGSWAALSVAATANDEIDLLATYSYKEAFKISLTDYFVPISHSVAKTKYFEWDADSTAHILEGAVNFAGTEKVPFTLLFAINVYGNDARKSNGDIVMSKYLELGYLHTFKACDFNAFVGAALDKPDTGAGEVAYYLNQDPGIVNLGIKLSRKIEITDKFSLPLQCSIITNPALQKAYFTCAISF